MSSQEEVLAALSELLGDPYRHGITWRRLPATVVDASDPTQVGVIFDGDPEETLITAVSLVGGGKVGDRVMVDAVPPAGLYVIGQSGATPYRAYRFLETVTFDVTTTVDPGDYTGILAVRQRLVGGGGGGGGAQTTAVGTAASGGGGGGGGYSESFILWSDLIASSDGYTVTVGTGGNGGAAGLNNGFNGTNTTAGGMTAAGGALGTAGGSSSGVATGAGGNGGGATGDIALNGDDGGNGQRFGGFAAGTGTGGASVLGGMRHCAIGNNGGAGLNGRLRGGGGSGGYLQASQTQVAGGNGAIGICIWDLFV